MIFVGYEPGSVAYRCYDPISRKVHVSRDVIFNEEASWDWTADQAAGLEFDFDMAREAELIPTIEVEFWLGTPPVNAAAEAGSQGTGGAHVQENEMENRGVSTPGLRTPTVRSTIGPEARTKSLGKSPPSDNLDADHDDEAPLRYRKLTNILGPGTPPGFAAREATQ
jgi:hypothetical protein